jgi:hypothetical protein
VPEAWRRPGQLAHCAGWRTLELTGPFPFEAVGIAAAVLRPLAEGRVSILLVSTFDTDVLLVKEAQLGQATGLLAAEGHEVKE